MVIFHFGWVGWKYQDLFVLAPDMTGQRPESFVQYCPGRQPKAHAAIWT